MPSKSETGYIIAGYNQINEHKAAAGSIGVEIEIQSVSHEKDGAGNLHEISFPNGGFNKTITEAVRLAGGSDKFYKREEFQNKVLEPEIELPCSKSKATVVWEWINGIIRK